MKQVVIKLFGFVLRYLVFLKENYAGGSMNFVTLDEYRTRLQEEKTKITSFPPVATDV